MRIRDWSADVCSSDLPLQQQRQVAAAGDVLAVQGGAEYRFQRAPQRQRDQQRRQQGGQDPEEPEPPLQRGLQAEEDGAQAAAAMGAVHRLTSKEKKACNAAPNWVASRRGAGLSASRVRLLSMRVASR